MLHSFSPALSASSREFALASLTYDLLRRWTGIRPPWGKMTGVRPVRLYNLPCHQKWLPGLCPPSP